MQLQSPTRCGADAALTRQDEAPDINIGTFDAVAVTFMLVIDPPGGRLRGLTSTGEISMFARSCVSGQGATPDLLRPRYRCAAAHRAEIKKFFSGRMDGRSTTELRDAPS